MTSELVAAAAPLVVSKAFSPGHITGFFDASAGRFQHFLHKGSRGAGFSIDKGILTTVYVYESHKTDYHISINGIRNKSAEVSKWVVEQYLKLLDRPYFISINHTVGIPIGFGLGSSGAAALSLSYALNDALDIGLSRTQAAQIAHHAEIICNTGLGTVIAEFVGGFEIRTSAGAPGIGKAYKVELDNYKAIILCLAPISTRSFLSTRMSEINGLGDIMSRKLSKSKNINDFLKMSNEFAETLGLTRGICKQPIEALKERGFEASVALFGHTVFTVVPELLTKEVSDILKEFGGTLLVCSIDSDGARSL